MSSQRYFHQLSGASYNGHVKLTIILNINTTIKMEENSSFKTEWYQGSNSVHRPRSDYHHPLHHRLCPLLHVQASPYWRFSKYLHDSKKIHIQREKDISVCRIIKVNFHAGHQMFSKSAARCSSCLDFVLLLVRSECNTIETLTQLGPMPPSGRRT